MSRVAKCLVLALGLGACHAALVSQPPLILTVDSSAYHHRGQTPVTVAYTLSNRGQALVYVAQCDGRPVTLIDRLSWGSWRFLEGGFCNGGQTSLLGLAPGDSERGAVSLDTGGHYRLQVGGALASAGPSESVASSEGFDVW